MAEQLPPSVAAALGQGRREVLVALEDLEREDRELAVLTAFVLSRRDDAEYARRLAIKTVERDDSIALACRLWLMAHRADDVGVAHTLLGALDHDLVVRGRWRPALGGELLSFLRLTLRHASASVRAATLVSLRLASERDTLALTFSRVLAASLAEDLQEYVGPIADEEERQDVALVSESLGSAYGQALPLAPRALERVALDLADAAERYAQTLAGLDPLLEHVRRRALLDDAGARSTRLGRAVQTLRVLADTASTRLVQALVSFGESVTEPAEVPDPGDTSAPDLGTEVAWAPAASVPLHLFFAHGDDAAGAFDVLERLLAARGRPAEVDAVLEDLPTRVASGLLRLLARLEQHDGRVEITLTDPHSAQWQRSLMLSREVIGKRSLESIAKRARASATGTPVRLDKQHVPQANTVRQVFQAVDAILQHGQATTDDIDNIEAPRQVNYYKHGARVLGLLDEDNQPTARARALVGVDHEHRLSMAAVFFEDSAVGRAWRTWAGKDRLADVDPQSAQEFLESCAVGLSGTTPRRRASTLSAWFAELIPHHPSR
ncbi:MAG: hypothetical protein KF729_08945 [Sandaracinaceae bacterium]|nr:hypothetical protein [Sandaracinaceae bacterium]